MNIEKIKSYKNIYNIILSFQVSYITRNLVVVIPTEYRSIAVEVEESLKHTKRSLHVGRDDKQTSNYSID
jgi:hypothetical protein